MKISVRKPVRLLAKPRSKRQSYYLDEGVASSMEFVGGGSSGGSNNSSASGRYVSQGGDILEGSYLFSGEDNASLDMDSGAKINFVDDNVNVKGYLQFDGNSALNINTLSLFPQSNNTQDLGSSTMKWRNLYGTYFSGNSETASKWATTRTIQLTGAVTGSANIDGSGNISITTTGGTSNGTYWGQTPNASGVVQGDLNNTGHIYPAGTGYRIGLDTRPFGAFYVNNIYTSYQIYTGGITVETITNRVRNSGTIGESGNMFSHIYTSQLTVSQVNNLSDKRLKENIEPVTDIHINQLGIYRYNLKDSSKRQIGVIAQEVQEVYPELVNEDEDGILSVNYSGLTALLLGEVKSLRKAIERLDKRIEVLENSIDN